MAFKKLSGTARKKVLHPDIYITKTNATLNMAFCEAIGLTEVGSTLGIDVMYDDEFDPCTEFALKVHKPKSEKGDILAKYNASHQSQIYIKTRLKQADRVITTSCHCKLEYNKKTKLWHFTIPETCTTSVKDSVEARREAKKAGKKVKRKGKKRKNKKRKKISKKD